MAVEKDLKNLLAQAIRKVSCCAGLKKIPAFNLEPPKDRSFGELSSNIALVLGASLGKTPLEVARSIEKALYQQLNSSNLGKEVDRVQIKGKGFINFFLSKRYLYRILLEIRKKRDNFGRVSLGSGKRVHIEFVSANPTGPLNVAHGRQAAFGDSLANILDFCGYKVFREYYLNDEGAQIDILGQSLRAKYLGLQDEAAEFPDSGYRGKYIDELAEELNKKYGPQLVKEAANNLNFFCQFAYSRILKKIKQDLNDFGVKYELWFSQRSLSKTGKITKALELLKKKGFIYEKESAWWLASTKFGDDKDRVVIKSNSQFTYIAPDIAYHQNKFRRRFSKLINVWGPDHHGYIARIKAALSCLGYEAERLSVLIVQLVSLARADKIIPMSTRAGQYISLAEIIRAVGKDAARFFFLMRKRDSHLRFDLELAKKQTPENPVYYIQYAHARILNILKLAGANFKGRFSLHKLKLSLLDKPEELALIQSLRGFASVVESCASSLEPHRITAYLQDLAKDLHHYYERHRVVSDDPALTQARLCLVDAVRIVLNNGLRLLGISAPEKM